MRGAVAIVGRNIVENSDASKSDYADNFRFTLLNDPKTVNAFALPGGPVFITRALYDKLETEAELAGVLGHEIGHVVGRHSAEQLAKASSGRRSRRPSRSVPAAISARVKRLPWRRWSTR